jgi:hypothetical protein
MYSSNTLITNNHHSHVTNTTTWHIYACGTISTTVRCQPNILRKSTPPLTTNYVKVHLLLHLSYDSIWLWCMDIQQRPNNATSNINNHQRQCKSTPPITLTNSTTIALSSIHVHTFNNHNSNKSSHHVIKNTNIDWHINNNPQQLHNLVQQFHTLSHKPSKVEKYNTSW